MSRSTLTLICAALCLVLAGCGDLAAGSAGEKRSDWRRAGQGGRARRASDAHPDTDPGADAGTPAGSRTCSASDGRFTVLLLGSDVRDGHRRRADRRRSSWPPSTRAAARWPWSACRATPSTCPSRPGEAYAERINTLYFDLQQSTGKRKAALEELRDALAYAFGTEIDHVALVDFDGLVRLIDSIGGIEVTLDAPMSTRPCTSARRASS